jgi:hypothetical protein
MKNRNLMKINLFLLILIFSIKPVKEAETNVQSSPLAIYSFSDLGYNTSTTYYHEGTLSLNIGCVGSLSGAYSARVVLHITGEDSYYYLRINGGPQGFIGGPGCEYFTGWQEKYVDPGFFIEGLNNFQIVIDNCPLSDDTSSSQKYLIILPDSYIEIYDASQLPLAIEWQGYEFNENNFTIYFLLMEYISKLPVNLTEVSVYTNSINVTAKSLGNGLYAITIPLPHEDIILSFSVESEGYALLETEYQISVNMSKTFLQEDCVTLIIIVAFISILIGGILIFMIRQKVIRELKKETKYIKTLYHDALREDEKVQVTSQRADSTLQKDREIIQKEERAKQQLIDQDKEIEKNRETIIDQLKEIKELRDKLKKRTSSDSTSIQEFVSDREIPIKMMEMIGQAKKEILITSPWIWKTLPIINTLEKKINEDRIPIKIIARPAVSRSDKYHRDQMEKLHALGFHIELEETLHAKMLIIDKKEMLIGSANLIEPSLSKNYETAIWTTDSLVIHEARRYFEDLFNQLFSARLKK